MRCQEQWGEWRWVAAAVSAGRLVAYILVAALLAVDIVAIQYLVGFIRAATMKVVIR